MTPPQIPFNLKAVVVARRTRWLRALLVAPVLVFALGASSHLAVRCTITGLLMAETCCPDAADPAPPPPAPHASVDDAGCCEQVTVATARIPAAGAASLRARPPEPTVALAISPAVPVATRPPLRPRVDLRTAWPSGSAPPLYVVTHSFLI